MKKFTARFVVTLPMISLLLLNFSQKADAQVIWEETMTMLRICNTIMNMHDADPENLELTIGRRECDARAYMVQLCIAETMGAYADCWNARYTQPVDSSVDLVAIIENNQ